MSSELIFIEKNVQCVDFQLTDGEPVLELELNSGEVVRKLIEVKRPPDTGAETCDNLVIK